MEEEKSKTLNLIALWQKQLRDKDKQIKTLQQQVTSQQLSVSKTSATIVSMEINKNASKFQDTFKCGDCGFVAMDNGGLKIHTDMHLKLKCDQFNFKAADFKGLRTHKLSCFVSCRICKHQVETTEKMKKHMKALHNEVLTAY